MHSMMRRVSLLALAVAPLRLQAQDSVPPIPVDTARIDSARLDTVRRDTVVLRPPEPSADQLKYLSGLRTVARGVAQLRSGVDGVARAEAAKDTARMRRAGQMLGGLCGTASTFMKQGRGTMKPTVYEDSARVKARNLVVQIDSLLRTTSACDSTAGRAPARTAGTVLGRLRSYETALQAFRTTVASPTPATPPAQP